VPPRVDLPRIIAHRGSPREAPENTLASFRKAHVAGARWVEFDAALTADARPVIFHDDSLERTSDGFGLMAETDFELVKQLDAGGWFGREFAGEPVPTLEEALELFIDLELCFNMELKTDPGREVELARAAIPIVQEMWPKDRPLPLISSFAREAVEAARELAPDWPREMLYVQVPANWAEDVKPLEVSAIGASQQHLLREQVMEIRGAGYKLASYTVNEAERAATLFQWGVDAVFTDVPGPMIARFGR
jgi:glycerophosphoryl diester phosphodiesterase